MAHFPLLYAAATKKCTIFSWNNQCLLGCTLDISEDIYQIKRKNIAKNTNKLLSLKKKNACIKDSVVFTRVQKIILFSSKMFIIDKTFTEHFVYYSVDCFSIKLSEIFKECLVYCFLSLHRNCMSLKHNTYSTVHRSQFVVIFLLHCDCLFTFYQMPFFHYNFIVSLYTCICTWHFLKFH